MLKQRIITAILLAPAIIGAIFYLPLEGFAYLMLAIMAISAWEWGPLMGIESRRARLTFVFVTSLIIAAIWQLLSVDRLWHQPKILVEHVQTLLWIAVIWWFISAFLTILYPKFSSFWSSHRSIRGVFGWLTLIPSWLAFIVLRSSEYHHNSYHGAQLIMFLFLMVWAADTGAYFVGKRFGKRKLMPNVSPGKTMEGFLGGIAVSCVLVVIAGYFTGWTIEQFKVVIPVTMLITTISALGDLNESMFKRQAGVKDSGSILPGHGGVLDRIDSLTATAPIYALCYIYFSW